MTEAAIAFGALIVFCLLTFGAAWVMATWMGAPPGSWRTTRQGNRRRSRRQR